VGRVDQEIEALLGENAREPLSAAEASREQPARKGHGLRSSPCQRQGHVVAHVPGERAGEASSLAAASKNEKLRRFHHAEVAL
jgi:hypothetical protein